MNLADWIIIIIVVLSALHAANVGFFQEAFYIGGLIVGYLLAAWQYQRVGFLLSGYLKSPWVADSAGFLIIFFVVTVAFGLAGRTARGVMKASGLRLIDRFLGGLLGALRGGLIVAFVLVGMTSFTPSAKWLEGSELAPYFQAVGRAAIWAAPAELRARFYQGLDLLRHPPQVPQAGPERKSSGK
jgi:membrane protein required for colicin V production